METKLTILEIVERHSKEWFGLSRPQRRFVLHYSSSGQNAVAAAKVAYPNIQATKVWASRLLANPRIKTVLAWQQGLSETQSVLAEVQSLVKKSRRKNARLDLLIAPWTRAVAALEKLIAQEKSNG